MCMCGGFPSLLRHAGSIRCLSGGAVWRSEGAKKGQHKHRGPCALCWWWLIGQVRARRPERCSQTAVGSKEFSFLFFLMVTSSWIYKDERGYFPSTPRHLSVKVSKTNEEKTNGFQTRGRGKEFSIWAVCRGTIIVAVHFLFRLFLRGLLSV